MNIALAIQRGVREVLLEEGFEHPARKSPPLFVQDISFAADGNSGDYIKSGFSQQESSGRWTDGPEAQLALSFPSPARNYRLTAIVEPFLEGRHSRQRVNILMNGELCLEEELTTCGLQTITTTFRASGPTTLTFSLPDAISPAELNTGSDSRKLALAFQSASISPVNLHGWSELRQRFFQRARSFFFTKPAFNTPGVLLARGGRWAPGVVAENFGHPENEGRWTLGPSAKVSFTVLSSQWPRGVELHLFGRPMELAGQHARVTFSVNDSTPIPLNFSAKGWSSFYLPLPLERARKQIINCEWFIENPTAPNSCGEGNDPRPLGMLMGRLELRSPSWLRNHLSPILGIIPFPSDNPGRSL